MQHSSFGSSAGLCVKVFPGQSSEGQLQERLQRWLDGRDVTVIDIKLGYSADVSTGWYSAMVVYRNSRSSVATADSERSAAGSRRPDIQDDDGYVARFWVPGRPSTWETAGEEPWKRQVVDFVKETPKRQLTGVAMDFVLPTLEPRGKPLDVDNLCEPVFSVLVGQLGWFGGHKRRVKWWRAIKRVGSKTGMELRVYDHPTPVFPDLPEALFDEVYTGPLPRSVKYVPEMALWAANQENKQLAGRRLLMRLEFGGDLNIATLTAGGVKSCVDCLYPLYGGTEQAPSDHLVDVLEIAKDVKDLPPDAVRIRLAQSTMVRQP